MTLYSEIKLVPIKLETKGILENLMTVYLHDLSGFADDLKVNKCGKFEYEGLELYFTKEELKPYLIYLKDDIVGFVLLNTGKYVPQDIDFSIHEFFILKGFRRRGIGAIATKKLFDSYRGKYRIDQLANNKPVINFWKNVYKDQGIEFIETIETVDDLECYTQVFNV